MVVLDGQDGFVRRVKRWLMAWLWIRSMWKVESAQSAHWSSSHQGFVPQAPPDPSQAFPCSTCWFNVFFCVYATCQSGIVKVFLPLRFKVQVDAASVNLTANDSVCLFLKRPLKLLR